jgi:hypothetical protein
MSFGIFFSFKQGNEKIKLGEKREKITFFIHINGIWPRRFGFWIRVNLARPQSTYIIDTGTNIIRRTSKPQLLVLLCLSLIQQFLIMFPTLSGSSANNGSDCSFLFRLLSRIKCRIRPLKEKRAERENTFDRSVFLIDGSNQRVCHVLAAAAAAFCSAIFIVVRRVEYHSICIKKIISEAKGKGKKLYLKLETCCVSSPAAAFDSAVFVVRPFVVMVVVRVVVVVPL